MRNQFNLIITMVLFITVVSFAQTYKISGKVQDSKTGEPLIGANVILKNTGIGAASDKNGYYTISVPSGEYTIICSYVGFEKVEKEISVKSDMTVNFDLTEHQFTLSVTVIADRAKERETPVAFSNIDKRQMEFNLGSRDIPLVMNTTPSVYATPQGGGAGDSRVNVRGFSQINTAIMINGIPINDMENGWVYWSNWDGLGDATSSIQIQRGLSAVNLATPSIGGTVNIITDPAQHKAGFIYKNEIGTGNFSKQTLFVHTGMIDGKFALSFGGVKKVGDGVVDKAWTDAYAYYFGAAYQINKSNRLEFYALGAPQRHGQRMYRLNAATFSHELARKLGYDEELLSESKLSEQGILYNANWNSVSTSYQGLQYSTSYWSYGENPRYNPTFIMERENYFHKPLVNFNWYSQFSDVFSLYSTVYWSGGQGGGSGTFGSIKYDYSLLQRVPDWDATIANNLQNKLFVDFNGDGIDEEYIVSTDKSGKTWNDSTINKGGILRNSVNNQWTVGLISKAFYRVSDKLNTSFGIDLRVAEIEHYREIRDLLGNDYYYWDGNQFESGLAYFKTLGDKIGYFNTNGVKWIGGYLQGEYTENLWTVYGTAGYSVIKYDFVDHFKKDANGNELKIISDWIGGYQFKGGASFRATTELDFFANAGYVAKVPIFDQVISDYVGKKIEGFTNEKFLSFEIGTNAMLLQNRLSIKANVYFTNWSNRAKNIGVINPDGTDGLVRLSGITSRHYGVELEGAYQPFNFFRLDYAFSQGFWTYVDDVSGTYIKDFTTGATENYNYYLKDLKVGDAPQTQLAAGVTIFPIKGLQAQLLFRYYDNYYSDFDPFSRTDPNDRAQVWKIPAFNLFDLNLQYKIPVQIVGLDVTVFGHIFNLFDELYVQDAKDNSTYNAWKANGVNHSADDAEIFPGLPRTYNAGFRIRL